MGSRDPQRVLREEFIFTIIYEQHIDPLCDYFGLEYHILPEIKHLNVFNIGDPWSV